MTASPVVYRWALVIALVLGLNVGVQSASEAWAASRTDEPPSMNDRLFDMPGVSAEIQRTASLEAQSAGQSAVAGMRPWLVGANALLSVAAFGLLVMAVRLRFASLSGEVARRAALFATVAAVLRTVDGALRLIVLRETSTTFGDSFVAQKVPDAEMIRAGVVAMTSTASVVWTAVVVGCFMGLSTYFRSDGLRELLARAARDSE